METKESLIAELQELEGRIALNVERRTEISSGITAFDAAVAPVELTALDGETTALCARRDALRSELAALSEN
jgi:hypothetical protein